LLRARGIDHTLPDRGLGFAGLFGSIAVMRRLSPLLVVVVLGLACGSNPQTIPDAAHVVDAPTDAAGSGSGSGSGSDGDMAMVASPHDHGLDVTVLALGVAIVVVPNRRRRRKPVASE
jgi:hypothetical protein